MKTIREMVEERVATGASLADLDLRGANLRGARECEEGK
jgi:uncharacterized protein YjbI with pentapeptide repeats